MSLVTLLAAECYTTNYGRQCDGGTATDGALLFGVALSGLLIWAIWRLPSKGAGTQSAASAGDGGHSQERGAVGCVSDGDAEPPGSASIKGSEEDPSSVQSDLGGLVDIERQTKLRPKPDSTGRY
jgi:hypothetical protein